MYSDNMLSPPGADAVSMRKLSPAGRNLEDDDDDDDDLDFEDTKLNGTRQQQERADAEQRAMNVVTNGGWGRGANTRVPASGLLGRAMSSPTAGSGGPSPTKRFEEDDEVD
jgi:palmitoyltransferase ZDHHC2/15/20